MYHELDRPYRPYRSKSTAKWPCPRLPRHATSTEHRAEHKPKDSQRRTFHSQPARCIYSIAALGGLSPLSCAIVLQRSGPCSSPTQRSGPSAPDTHPRRSFSLLVILSNLRGYLSFSLPSPPVHSPTRTRTRLARLTDASTADRHAQTALDPPVRRTTEKAAK